jgi:hypothetical protein
MNSDARSTTNSLPTHLEALQRLVAFAESKDPTIPVLILKSGDGLATASSTSRVQIAKMTLGQIDVLRAEYRTFLRDAAAGNARMGAPMHIALTVVTHAPDAARRGQAQQEPRGASIIIDGNPRDILFEQTHRVIANVAIETLKTCQGCDTLFVKVTKKEYCSTRCQSRLYMRKQRAKERAEREALTRRNKRTGGRHGTKTR